MKNLEPIIIDVLEEIIGIPIDETTINLNLANDLCLDSLDIIEAMLVLEETLDIEITYEAYNIIHTIGQLIFYLNTKHHFKEIYKK